MSTTPKKQILIVEDNQLNREMLVEILADQYAVLQAENGREALDVLQQNKETVALILLDVMMPVMDGYTFLDRIREDDELSLIPVIVMTQSGSEADEVSALTHGATDFVPKPYRPQIIMHRIASLIKLRETAAMVNQFKFDRLTGLYSKEYFYEKVREQLQANPDEEYSIICSNIENFKLYNDTLGVSAGDHLLKQLTVIAQNMVGDTGFCGRMGADRFLCLQQRDREIEDRQNFGCPMDIDIDVTSLMKNTVMRWGIYEITDRTIPVEQMCDRAPLAADSIKGQYNQYFAVYDDTLRSKLLREKAITDAMETALAEKQFSVYLQPKYSLKDKCMVGAEALVRWNHPEWGFVSPGEFIPLFEKNGFIFKLDQYVWEQVCMLIRDWQRKGYTPLPVSVNVSRVDVYQTHLTDILSGLIRKYEVDPAYLHLEITESAYAEHPRQIISVVEELRKLGFVIEMDDFGSGYSSLNMLSQMKLDILKLDMKFIQNEIVKPIHQSIINDIIIMAHRMDLRVVAEGVETLEQMKRLETIGCDYVQGYYFSKPLPVVEFEELWTSQSSQDAELAHEEPQEKSDLPILLVADEDDGFREKISRIFEEQYRVVEASNVHSAVELLKSCVLNHLSAVIMSKTLPENGAASILQFMRQNPAFWDIPVLSIIPSGEAAEDLLSELETDDFLCKLHPPVDIRKRVQRLIDIAAVRRRETALKNAANRDYLTGLLNRRGFQAAMDSLRKEDFPLALCLFDLDNLKSTNDTFGHDEGDNIICAFADILRNQMRTQDIKCRYGGDEFIVVLKHIKNAESATKKGTEICKLFNSCFADSEINASCSCGITLCGNSEIPISKIIDRADEAMYRAKREAKGGCFLCEQPDSNAL